MNRNTILGVVFVISILFSFESQADTANGTAKLDVISALSINNTRDLDFGEAVVGDGAGTIPAAQGTVRTKCWNPKWRRAANARYWSRPDGQASLVAA